jgi:16S rRNA (guanine966-N2)-methyltransferase
MAIKLLGGMAKGFTLQTPKGDLIRPTSAILRRKAFDTYQDWDGWIFIDGCAGTGAVGLEAWSRGCKRAYFIEKHRKVFSILEANINKIKESYRTYLEADTFKSSNQPIEKWLIGFEKVYETFDEDEKSKCLLFLDPPYHLREVYQKVIFNRLIEQKWFKGWLWVESDEKKGISSIDLQKQGISFFDIIAQGDSYLGIVKITAHQ